MAIIIIHNFSHLNIYQDLFVMHVTVLGLTWKYEYEIGKGAHRAGRTHEHVFTCDCHRVRPPVAVLNLRQS